MSNLLTIETAFLSNQAVKQALNLTEIRAIQRTITNGQKKKFAQTLQLSKLVLNTVNWFSSEEGKQVCLNEGISWTNEDIANKIFGWQKSFFYKVVKAGKLEDTVVDNFNTKCDEAEANGQDANRSLEGLLKFAKVLETASDGGGNEGDGDGEADAEVEIRVPTILTFTYKTEQGNVSVRIDENGKVKTTNTADEIRQAIQYLIETSIPF
jgi:hypothetical protein